LYGYPGISLASSTPVTTTYLQIFPPNQSTPIYLRYTSTGCAKPVHLMTVNTIVPRSGGD
jgi:hypothetical protein